MTDSEPKTGVSLTGSLFESPLALLVLGLFPSIAITTHVSYALALGGGVLVVMAGSRLVASLLAPVIPPRIRFGVHLVVIATLVTAVDQAVRAYAPALSKALGIYVPLVAVNCLILGRMAPGRSSAGKAVLGALGMGVSFALSLSLVALVREVLGSGTITLFPFGRWNGIVTVAGLSRNPIGAFALPAGAFLVVAYLAALANWAALRRQEARKGRAEETGTSARSPSERESPRGSSAPEATG